jgi:dTDP-glucose 4,6-dehydratase
VGTDSPSRTAAQPPRPSSARAAHGEMAEGGGGRKKQRTLPASGAYEPGAILVTGGAGFIASHVVIALVRKYPAYKVVCLDKLDYCSSLSNLLEVRDAPNFKFIKGNILSADLVRYVLETERIDTIIHAAAQTHVDNSFGNSFAFTQNNVMGTHVLIETAKTHGIRRFIHVSTDEVYGSSYDEEPRHVESDALEPTNPYAATKAAAEQIVMSYYHSFGMPVIITRGNNVYGPHQYPEKVIPKFIRRLLNGLPCCIHGDGSNSRHYIYVGDVAAAFDTILHKGVDGETYNVGCEIEHTNLQVAETLVRSLKKAADPREHIEFVADRAFNDVRYYISSEKLRQLGWDVQVDFETGLQLTIDWYAKVSKDWWEIGTDSALAAHPVPKGQVAETIKATL